LSAPFRVSGRLQNLSVRRSENCGRKDYLAIAIAECEANRAGPWGIGGTILMDELQLTTPLSQKVGARLRQDEHILLGRDYRDHTCAIRWWNLGRGCLRARSRQRWAVFYPRGARLIAHRRLGENQRRTLGRWSSQHEVFLRDGGLGSQDKENGGANRAEDLARRTSITHMPSLSQYRPRWAHTPSRQWYGVNCIILPNAKSIERL